MSNSKIDRNKYAAPQTVLKYVRGKLVFLREQQKQGVSQIPFFAKQTLSQQEIDVPTHLRGKKKPLVLLRGLSWIGKKKDCQLIVNHLSIYGKITDDGIYIFQRSHGVQNCYYMFLKLIEHGFLPSYTSGDILSDAIEIRNGTKIRRTTPNNWRVAKSRLNTRGGYPPTEKFKAKFEELLSKLGGKR
jgi:hypothetical protein